MELPQFPSHPGCTSCSLHACVATSIGTPSIHLPSSLLPGEGVPAIVFIGQNPGFNEDQQNEPFVGQTGEMVRKGLVLGESFDTRASIYLTNAVRCWTPDNAKPTRTHLKACSPITISDLAVISSLHPAPAPLIIVCLGASATDFFFLHLLKRKTSSQKGAFSENAHTFDVPCLGNRPVTHFSTYHPAYISRSPNAILAIDAHMALLSRFLSGSVAPLTEARLCSPRFPST